MEYFICLACLLVAIFWNECKDIKFQIDCSNCKNIESSVLYVYSKTIDKVLSNCRQEVREAESGIVTTWFDDSIENESQKINGVQSVCSWNNRKFVHLYNDNSWFCSIEFNEDIKPDISILLGNRVIL